MFTRIEYRGYLTTAIIPVPANDYGIGIYPNPVRSTFTIDSLKLSDRWRSLDIVSADGKNKLVSKNISDQQKLVCNIEKLSAGFYIAFKKQSEQNSLF